MPVKVSVVVPVYNPGGFIDPLIDSLLGQSMSQEHYEVVLVDDGSTDETPEKLDRLAREHEHVKALHIPNSGWPGRPRNVGIENSDGEYVLFVDHDDELAPDALERLHAYATENDSDVVVGKEVRRTAGWGVLGVTFDRNRPRANLRTAPLLSVMTPHKMFRRRLLDEHKIRFFEGPRRMEDHPFVLEAYFRADVISVLADRPVYYWNRRPDRGNAGARAFDWAQFYVFMRDTLDVIERFAEPGPFRDRLLSFYYDSKGLGMLSRSVPNRPRQAVQDHFEALRDLAEERFPPRVDAQLKGVVKARSQLLRAGDFDGLVALAQQEHSVRPHVELIDLGVDDQTRLRVHVRAGLLDGAGAPLTFHSVDGRLHWRPPVDLEVVSPDALDVTPAYTHKRIELALRHRETSEVFLVSGDVASPSEELEEVPVTVDVTFSLDPEDVAFGRALERGVYDVFVRIRLPPWGRQTRLPSLPVATPLEPVGPALRTERSVVAFTTPAGNLALDVDQTRFSLLAAALPSPPVARLGRNQGRATLSIPLPGLQLRGRVLRGRLRLEAEDGDGVVRARLRIAEDGGGGAVARAQVALGPAGVGFGRWRVVTRLQGRRADLGMLLVVGRRQALTLTTTGGEVLDHLEPLSPLRHNLGRVGSTLTRTRRAVRRRLRPGPDRPPAHDQPTTGSRSGERTP